MAVQTAPIAAGSLVTGYLTARFSGYRPLGGVVLAVAGAYCAREWHRTAGTGTAALLTAVYLGGFGGSHPLAKRIGGWPSLLVVAGAAGGAAHVLSDRRR
jgi:hypothetical protein